MKTSSIDVLSRISNKLYHSAADVMHTASNLIPANTFCIANLDQLSTVVLAAFNRGKVLLNEGLVVDNQESYCALVTENRTGPLIIDNNLTHPLTKDMDATKFVGGCSFLGVPVLTPEGEIFGSLCAFDDQFYSYQEQDVQLLLSLSRFFTNLLELDDSVKQLEQAQADTMKIMEEKASLLAVLSHEIRTPMNGILGMASLLQSTGLNEEQNGFVEVIETCSNSLLSVMGQILEYSKIEAGKMELDWMPFDLVSSVEQALQVFAYDASLKGVALQAYMDEGLNGIYEGDALKIRQILLNLVSNAIKFTDQGEVTVHVSSTSGEDGEEWVSFCVRDTGIGIAADRQSRLFQSFSQVHDMTTKGKYGGIGLGLSICKQYAEMMGGSVQLQESSDAGTCFALTIPLKVVNHLVSPPTS